MSRRRRRSGIAGIGRVLGCVVLAAVLFMAAAFLTLTLREYKPDDIEALDVPESTRKAGETLTFVSFNTGYAALGEDADFFMDGGKTSRPDSAEVINTNMSGIMGVIGGVDADFYLLQEVDTDSKRSYRVNEAEYYGQSLGLPYMFALNYSADFVPYPVSSMIGRVHSGLATYTGLAVTGAERVQLPVPFSWPVRCFNLKRCLLVTRTPVEGGERELVVVNLHLEAYDNGEGKAAQTAMLYDFISAEYEKGNYVIAGGDFNQTFPGAHYFPSLKDGNWAPGVLDENMPRGFSVVYAGGAVPTCRLLDVPYKGNEEPQYYIIDGYIVSDNVSVDSVEVIDQGFKYSDHQPVKLTVTLLGD